MKCLNPKLLVGLGVLGVGLYVVAPDLAIAALPLLILALCPLMMWVMMKSMGGMGSNAGGANTDTATASASQLADGGVQANSSVQPAAAADAPASRPTTTELQSQLQNLQAQQTAIADQLHARAREERQQTNGQGHERSGEEAVPASRQHTQLDGGRETDARGKQAGS